MSKKSTGLSCFSQVSPPVARGEDRPGVPYGPARSSDPQSMCRRA